MSRGRKELFTEKVTAGSRTYFFDVKESAEGTKYLVISESRQKAPQRTHNRLMIFQEHLKAFDEVYEKAMRFLGVRRRRWRLALRLPGRKAVGFLRARSKAYSVNEKRQEHPNAYKKWTSEDDQRLREEFAKGSSISELAELLQRQESAIQSRLKRLGMSEPDETADGE
jgi:hypothetical protein